MNHLLWFLLDSPHQKEYSELEGIGSPEPFYSSIRKWTRDLHSNHLAFLWNCCLCVVEIFTRWIRQWWMNVLMSVMSIYIHEQENERANCAR